MFVDMFQIADCMSACFLQVSQGEPEGKPDLTLTISDQNFVKLVMGKMGPQQARLLTPSQIAHARYRL